jgi:Ca2+-binding RTX toxin-like protein
MLLMNKRDQRRPLDGRAGHDPFAGTDPDYSCDGLHQSSSCGRNGASFDPEAAAASANVVPDHVGHNELLGGHGSDTIHAGDAGDVIWGDYNPFSQPSTQTDRLFGGPGKDFIYASHGHNVIDTGSGADVVHAHFGYGSITCGSNRATVFLSHQSRKRYTLAGCSRISYRTLGY